VHVTTSAWVDLVFHGLAHLPVDGRDASGLYDGGYVAWAAARLAGERTLPLDAAKLAELYDRTPAAPLLHALAVLDEDPARLERTAAQAFATLAWAAAGRARLARQLVDALPEALIDLFRIALWGEVRAGYLDLREREVVPRYAERAAPFAATMARLGMRCAALVRPTYCLSHPLRGAGRAFHVPGAAGPIVIVGIEDAALGVEPGAPVVQAVHEVMVGLTQDEAPRDAGPAGCRADRAGFAAHLGPEVVALCLGARLLSRGEVARAHEEWLARLYPDGAAQAAAELEQAGLRPRRPVAASTAPGALVRWLADGDAVPEGYEETWQRSSARAARRRL
jgi:hypothetical protein